MSNQSDGKTIIDIHNEIKKMPEYLLEGKLRTLDLSIYVFKNNYLELNKLLVVYKDKKKALTIWDETNRHIQDAFHLEITRKFHNFVASVKSLIEHTRIIYRELYLDQGLFPEYQQEVDKQFAKNPFTQFVEDLRDYCLHYKPLPIYSDMKWVKNPPKFETTFRISIETVKRYSSWSSLGKKYLKIQKDDIDISELVDKYYKLVINFHKWMQTHQVKIHESEFTKLNKKKKELAELLVPGEIRDSLSSIEQYENPDKAFHRLLSHNRLETLKKIPLSSIEHVDKLVHFIEEDASISINEELQNRIKNIYKKFIQ